MTQTFRIHLEATNPDRGNFRAYRIDAGPDLFGHWLVQVTYGRIGAPGRTLTYSAADAGGARRIVHRCLARRATAPRRVGVPYQIRYLTDPHRWTTLGLPHQLKGRRADASR